MQLVLENMNLDIINLHRLHPENESMVILSLESHITVYTGEQF